MQCVFFPFNPERREGSESTLGRAPLPASFNLATRLHFRKASVILRLHFNLPSIAYETVCSVSPEGM